MAVDHIYWCVPVCDVEELPMLALEFSFLTLLLQMLSR